MTRISQDLRETGVLIFGALGDVTNLNCDMIIMVWTCGSTDRAGGSEPKYSHVLRIVKAKERIQKQW